MPLRKIPAPTKVFPGLSVLIVEDNATNLAVAVGMLEALHVDLTVAKNGAQALELFNENNFDLVLMDIHMPVLNGIETTIRMRQKASRKTLPVIAMSAGSFKEDRHIAISAGMNDYVAKPITFPALIAAIEKFFPGQEHSIDRPQSSADPTGKASNTATLDMAGFDTVSALQRLDHDHELLRRVIQRFRDDGSKWSETATSLYTSDDSEALYRHAHTLKGAAGNSGATAVAKAAELLENAIRANQSKAEVEAALDNCVTAIAHAIREIDTHLPKTSYAWLSDSKGDHHSASAMLTELESIIANRSSITDDTLIAVGRRLVGWIDDDQLIDLHNALVGYDYQAASRMVNRIKSIISEVT